MAETPRFAHLITLLFLGCVFAAFVGVLIIVVAAASKAKRVARFTAACVALMALGYTSLLFGASLMTPNRSLAPGQWKYFCEADCHIAYTIDSYHETATLGPEAKLVSAKGRFVVVRLKTWFDRNSIAPWRGDSPLTPDPRTVVLLDERGRSYPELPQMAEILPGISTPLSAPLRPGQSYLTTLVFDLPADARAPRLFISDAEPITRLLIDHENSPWHGKIYLTFPPHASPTAAMLP